MHHLTLCLIARDEEALLPGCLASVQGVVDALVVVDTGSADRTAEIARQAGAKVVSHEWREDFAAARNAALEHVRSGFVLALDADERLGPGAKAALREALRGPAFDCGLLPLHDADSLEADPAEVVAGRARRGEPVLLPRLLRRTDDLAWQGVVHEQVAAWLARGRRAVVVPAPIVHYGAVPSLREARQKNERNLRLLQARCALEPRDALGRAFLAREYQRIGRSDLALEEADRAWSLVQELAAQGPPRIDVVLPATLRAWLLLAGDRLDEAARTLADARAWGGEHPNVDLLGGAVLERLALATAGEGERRAALRAAEASFRACLAQDGRGFVSELMPGATSWAASTRLGTVLLLQDRAAEALACFEAALEARKDSIEAALGRIEALVEVGRAPEALAALPPYLEAGLPDAWVIAAAAARRLGQVHDAELFLARAEPAAREKPWIGSHRPWRAGRLAARAAS